MFKITVKAKEKLHEISEEKNIRPHQFLRLSIPPIWSGEGDFGIVIDHPTEDDIKIIFKNETVLLIEPSINEKLLNATFDYIVSIKQTGFHLDIYPEDNTTPIDPISH